MGLRKPSQAGVERRVGLSVCGAGMPCECVSVDGLEEPDVRGSSSPALQAEWPAQRLPKVSDTSPSEARIPAQVGIGSFAYFADRPNAGVLQDKPYCYGQLNVLDFRIVR